MSEIGVGEGSTLSKADYEALAAFRHALRRFLRYAEDGARGAGLTPQQHQLLLAIKGQPGRDWASITELAENLQLRHNTTVELVDRSETAGLVRREPDPGDRRAVRVVLTPEGDAVLARLTERNRTELEALRRAIQLPFLDGPLAGEIPPAGDQAQASGGTARSTG